MKIFAVTLPGMFEPRPREDYFAYNLKNRAFAVADGVTLEKGVEYFRGPYPSPSPSGELARTFCQTFVACRDRSLEEAFIIANKKAGAVNKNRKNKVLYASTAAVAQVRGNQLLFGQVNDCGVAIVGSGGRLKFNSPVGWRYSPYGQFFWPKGAEKWPKVKKTRFHRTVPRNAVNRAGQPIGYGVVTGEMEARLYLTLGKERLSKGDVVVLYSDGFAPYITLPEFRRLLRVPTKRAIEKFVKKKASGGEPKWKLEKTLLVIRP